MFEHTYSTPDRAHLNSLEVAMRARALDHKTAQLVAGYRKANGQANRGNFFRRILTTLVTSFQ